MCELLVKAVDASHVDPVIDLRGCYKKGDIVAVVDDGHIWGVLERPPTFVLVKVLGLDKSVVIDRIESWESVLDYEIVGTDPVLDGGRIRVWVTLPGSANEYGLTLAQVESWLNGWNAVIVSNTTNEVRFDITIENIYTSDSFWGVSPASLGIIITEQSYVQATGTHTATVDFSGSSVSEEQIVGRIESRTGVITDITGDVITCEFYRTELRGAFLSALQEVMYKVLVRRRYYFAEADVNTALGLGGVVSLTAAQLAAKVLDKTI